MCSYTDDPYTFVNLSYHIILVTTTSTAIISHKTACNSISLVVGLFIEIKTGYWGFETKQNLVFRMLVTVQ